VRPLVAPRRCLSLQPTRPLRSDAPVAANPPSREKLRNIAVIAHVDHGKTTLVDEMLQQGGAWSGETERVMGEGMDSAQELSERVMDSGALERERGITITSKNTSFVYEGHRINVIDTPGHGDFGGEVERVLSMVQGCLLVVDGSEGAMTQTRFVMSKALAAGVKPIVVLNKMDRVEATSHKRFEEVETELFDLFASLGASDDQMDYATLYASARDGWVTADPSELGSGSMQPLFDALVETIPPPPESIRDDGFQMLVTSISSDPYLGRMLTGRVSSGSIKPNDRVVALSRDGEIVEEGRVIRVQARHGLRPADLNEGVCGDIISISGLSTATATCTIVSVPGDISAAKGAVSVEQLAPPIECAAIDPPVLGMAFAPNSSALAGRDEATKFRTYPQIKSRLDKELESNVSIQVIDAAKQSGRDAAAGPSGEALEVRGRGEMQLGVLIESMRREGFELSLYPPKVLMKEDPDNPGRMLEPMEEVSIDVDEQYSSKVIEALNQRGAELQEMADPGPDGKQRLSFVAPTRSLVGMRSQLVLETRGTAVLNHLFHGWQPAPKDPKLPAKKGAIISMATGKATSYALDPLQARGTLYIEPGDEVYAGMICGVSAREQNVEINPTRSKALTNMRASGKDEAAKIIPPKRLTLEELIAICRPDEIIEVTPSFLRLRKAQFKAAGTSAKKR
jgi:GTP-binding protein